MVFIGESPQVKFCPSVTFDAHNMNGNVADIHCTNAFQHIIYVAALWETSCQNINYINFERGQRQLNTIQHIWCPFDWLQRVEPFFCLSQHLCGRWHHSIRPQHSSSLRRILNQVELTLTNKK